MDSKIRYPKTKREDTVCNICLRTVNRLSWDHVPPKGSFLPSHTLTMPYPEGSDGDIIRYAKSVDGLKFQTLCKDCNSMLGSKYDKELNSFLNSIQSILRSPICLPELFHIKAKPTLIIKAVLGHILASKTGICSFEIDEYSRQFISNDDAILSSDIKVYYWYYPYDRVVITTDKMPYDIESGQIAHFSVLKYYPLAFMVMFQSQANPGLFEDLTEYNTNNINTVADLPIRIHPYDWNFPESSKYCKMSLVTDDHTDIVSVKK